MSSLSLLAASGAAGVLGAALGWFLNNRLGARSLVAARIKAEDFQRAALREAENLKRQQIVEARRGLVPVAIQPGADSRAVSLLAIIRLSL